QLPVGGSPCRPPEFARAGRGPEEWAPHPRGEGSRPRFSSSSCSRSYPPAARAIGPPATTTTRPPRLAWRHDRRRRQCPRRRPLRNRHAFPRSRFAAKGGRTPIRMNSGPRARERRERTLIKHFAAAVAAAWMVGAAPAPPADPASQDTAAWPTRPVIIVCPFAAGISTDLLARAVATALGDKFGQQFVVEDRPGANGNIGAASAAKAPPDGYTLL